VSLTRSRALIELGKRLVSDLDVADDLLASWMAHYVAQRIKEAEEAPDDVKAAATDSCARAVLDIWEHRSSLPDRVRPMKDLEPVLRALASLDLEQTDYRYYSEILREATRASADDANRWLSLATGLDYSARLVMQFALRSAAQVAASQAEPWVEMAAIAGAGDHAERAVVRFILNEGDTEDVARGESILKDRIDRLEQFASLATSVAATLRAQLESSGFQSGS